MLKKSNKFHECSRHFAWVPGEFMWQRFCVFVFMRWVGKFGMLELLVTNT